MVLLKLSSHPLHATGSWNTPQVIQKQNLFIKKRSVLQFISHKLPLLSVHTRRWLQWSALTGSAHLTQRWFIWSLQNWCTARTGGGQESAHNMCLLLLKRCANAMCTARYYRLPNEPQGSFLQLKFCWHQNIYPLQRRIKKSIHAQK